MRAFVDRIESGVATLLLGDDESVTARMPAAWLPEGAKEGSVLQIAMSVDHQATAAAHDEVQSLLDSLSIDTE